MQIIHHLLSFITLVLSLSTALIVSAASTLTKSSAACGKFTPFSATEFDDQFWIEVVFQSHVPQPVDDFKDRPYGPDDSAFRLRPGNGLRIDPNTFTPGNGGTFQKVIVTEVFEVSDFFELGYFEIVDRTRYALEVWSDTLSAYTYPGFNPITSHADNIPVIDGTTDFTKSSLGIAGTIVKTCVPSRGTTRLELHCTVAPDDVPLQFYVARANDSIDTTLELFVKRPNYKGPFDPIPVPVILQVHPSLGESKY